MIGILSSFASTFPFWIFLNDLYEVDDFKQIEQDNWSFRICCDDVTTGSVADPALVTEAVTLVIGSDLSIQCGKTVT